MSRYLKSLELNYPSAHFDHATREAAALYVHLLQGRFRIPTGDIEKIVLRQGPLAVDASRPGLCHYAHPFKHLDWPAADAAQGQGGKRLIDEVNDALLSLAMRMGWDTQALHALHEEVVRRAYRFDGSSGRALKNPSGTLSAIAAWQTDRYIHVGVRVTDVKAKTTRFAAATRIGIGLGLLETLLGPLYWSDDRHVRLFHRNKRDYWHIDTHSGNAQFHFPRAEAGDAHGQYDLARMYLDGWIVEQDNASAMRWLEKSAAQGFARAQTLLRRMDAGEGGLADPLKNSQR